MIKMTENLLSKSKLFFAKFWRHILMFFVIVMAAAGARHHYINYVPNDFEIMSEGREVYKNNSGVVMYSYHNKNYACMLTGGSHGIYSVGAQCAFIHMK